MEIPNDATGDALRRLRDCGSNLSKPMEIDFFVAAPSRESGERISAEVTALGFQVSLEQDEESDAWTCYCSKTLVPEHALVSKIEAELGEIARPYGGFVDGFGSYGNVEEHKN